MKVKVIFLVILGFLMFLNGCSDSAPHEEPYQYTLTIITNTNEGPVLIDQQANTLLNLPILTKENFFFEGWFLDSNYTNEFDLIKMPSMDLTIYAKWSAGNYSDFQYSLLEDNTYSISYQASATYVRIPRYYNGRKISTIAKSAFYFNENVEVVFIPDTVTTINDLSFSKMPKLNEVVFEGESNLKYIGKNSFSNNSSLKTIYLPDSLETIDNFAFHFCFNLSLINIGPNSKMTTIGEYAFSHTSISNLNLPKNLSVIEDWVFYNTFNLKTITIPKNVLKIGYGAFKNSKLEEIIFEETSSLMVIDESAFEGCDEISDIVIPKTVIKIEKYAFLNCSKLKNAFFETGSLLTTLSDDVFRNCSVYFQLIDCNVENLLISKETQNLNQNYLNQFIKIKNYNVEVGNQNFSAVNGVLYSYDLKTLIKYPSSRNDEYYIVLDDVETIDIAAFFDAKLRQIYLPESLINIKNEAFKGSSIQILSIPASLQLIGDYAFENTKLNSLVIPKNVSNIGSYAFASIPTLTSISFEEGTKLSILSESLFSSSAISTISIPLGIEEIANNAFDNCLSLTSVNIPKSVKIIDEYAFNNCQLLNQIIYEYDSLLEKVDLNAFNGCTKLLEIYLPQSVNTIIVSNNDFIYKFAVSENNQYFTSVDGVLYNKDVSVLISYPSKKPTENFTMPNTVLRIATKAFYKPQSLMSIQFSQNLQVIETEAFVNTNFSKVTIPDSVTVLSFHSIFNNIPFDLYITNPNPPVCGKAFENVTKIYVPAELVLVYKNSDYWSLYKDIIVQRSINDNQE